MPILSPDLSQVESREPLEEGSYPATISHIEASTSKAGNPQFVVTTKVTHDGKNYTLFAYVAVGGKAAFQFVNFLKACGLGELAAKYKAGDKTPFDSDQVLGANVIVNVKQDMYNGEVTNKVASFQKA